ncbi:UNVERIFIED_ORG: hypothetical protein HNP28_003526 [Comamonas terrigena]
MPGKEKIYILKHTAEGFELSLDRDFENILLEDGGNMAPGLDTLKVPRWEHWY